MSDKPAYQVWHDKEWVRRQGDAAKFPDDFERVADVHAETASDAVILTTDVNHDLLAPRPLVRGDPDRDTQPGDVIVTSSGKPYQIQANYTFKELAVEQSYEQMLADACELPCHERDEGHGR